MNLIQSLKHIGLKEKEAAIYTALLQLGKATAYQVAKKCGIKKPTVYVILDRLVERGIATKEPRANTSEFSALSPDELFSNAKNLIKETKENALEEMKNISKGKQYKVRASYFEGQEGIRTMYKKFLKDTGKSKYSAFYAHERDATSELLKFFKEVRQWFQRAGVHRRGITVYDEPMKRFFDPSYMKRRNISLRALPIEKYNSNISVEMAGPYTQLFSHKHMQGIIIDNPDVANTFKQIFEIVWAKKGLFKNLEDENTGSSPFVPDTKYA